MKTRNRPRIPRDGETPPPVEDPYRMLFELSPVPTWVFDRRSLEILDANEAAVKRYGWSRQEFRKLMMLDLYGPQDQPAVRASLERIRGIDPAVAGSSPGPVQHQTKSGAVLETEVLWSPVSFRGRPAVVASALDASGAVRAERRFRGLLESAPDAMVIVGGDGRIAFANTQTERLFGYRREELLGKSVEILVPAVHRERHSLHRAAYTREPHVRPMGAGFEFTGLKQDGTEFPVEISLSPLHVENEVYFTSAIRDVTEQRKVADEIRKLNVDLEQRVHERTAALERSNEDLRQFAYVASHDLQEPLRMVSSYAALLAKRYRGQLDADADEFIGYMTDGATQLHRLIEDLLTYSRIESQTQAFHPTSCEETLQQALDNLQMVIQEAGAEVTHASLPTVLSDGRQLTQLFQNLISNALKFRSPGVPPVVHVEARRDGRTWVFSIRDNGIGIDPRHAERIFVIFQRLHRRAEYPGTGIGLAICRKIVKHHGGRIWVESAPGSGSTFFFTVAD